MRRGTRGKDGLSPHRKVDLEMMGDDHILNAIAWIQDHLESYAFPEIIIDGFNKEIERREELGIRGAVKDTREWVSPEIQCLSCKDIVSSPWEGKFTTCSCGKCSIDSTVYYTRVLGNPEDIRDVPVHLLPGEFTHIESYHDYVKQAREARVKKNKSKKKTSKALSRKMETSPVIK